MPNPRTRPFLIGLTSLLVFNSLYLAYMIRVPVPPGYISSSFFFMGNVVLHLLMGFIALVVTLRSIGAWVKALRAARGGGKIAGWIALLGLLTCLAAGLGLFIWGNMHPMHNVLVAHGIAAVVALLAGSGWWMSRAKMDRTDRPAARALGRLAATAVIPGAFLLWFASIQVDNAGRIHNPTAIPVSMNNEGDGPHGKFWPSSNQTVDSKFFPPEYFTDSKSCGATGCHPDIYNQWNASAHHMSSFNNQWYRKSIEYMQEVIGTKPSKWCGGCHDMAVLLTEKPGTGKPRFDYPVKNQVFPASKFPESHAGIGCAACHSVVQIKSTMGQGDYMAAYPPMHEFVVSDNPLMKAATKFLTRLAPEPHRKTFLKPFHTQDTAKFCSSCHKVHLDTPVNNFRWFRGFNDYDPWQGSGVSGQGARSFYYPKTKEGNPDFKKCADCHMPLTKSEDAGNISGKVHSHAFPGANTALPFVNHDLDQLKLVQKFLQDGALSIDIFALRREKGGPGTSATRKVKPAGDTSKPEGEAASLMGDVATTGHSSVSGTAVKVNEDVIAPINRAPVFVKRGEEALVDLVVRTRKVGHAFPGGTFDAFDVWVELEAHDEKGKQIFFSGKLDFPNGPVERGAHQYRALLIDQAGNPINKRNAWAARVRIYARAIPPGAADTVHYRIKVPRDCGNKITMTAKLNYRKFSWWNTQFAFRGRPEDPSNPNYSKGGLIEGVNIGRDGEVSKTSGPVTFDYDNRPMKFDADLKVVAAKDTSKVPILPITSLCTSTATLEVTDGNAVALTAPRVLEKEKDRERWNDYGIGLMLQGDFQRATNAFKQAMIVDSTWPEPLVNVGRVRLLEGDLDESIAAFEKVLGKYAAKRVPMTPYLEARTRFFYGLALKGYGRYDEAIFVWNKAMEVFPNDRELRNQLGRVHFQYKRFDEAISHFEHVLTIDPEDLTAHYNLMLCYKGKGSAFAEKSVYHQKLYYRFKSDETVTHLAGPYLREHPHDNNEAQTIHDHDGAAPPDPRYLPADVVKAGVATPVSPPPGPKVGKRVPVKLPTAPIMRNGG